MPQQRGAGYCSPKTWPCQGQRRTSANLPKPQPKLSISSSHFTLPPSLPPAPPSPPPALPPSLAPRPFASSRPLLVQGYPFVPCPKGLGCRAWQSHPGCRMGQGARPSEFNVSRSSTNGVDLGVSGEQVADEQQGLDLGQLEIRATSGQTGVLGAAKPGQVHNEDSDAQGNGPCIPCHPVPSCAESLLPPPGP